MVRPRDRSLADRRVHSRDGFLQKDCRRRDDNRHRAPRANLKSGHASQAARRCALAGGQSPGHGGFWRDGGAQRPAGASPAGCFGAALITQPAERRYRQKYRHNARPLTCTKGGTLKMGTFNSTKTFPYSVEDVAPVAKDVMDHFEGQDYEVTETNIPTGGVQVSIRKGGTFKAIIGMKTALNIKIEPVANGTTVDAGVGIFGQQAIPTAITLLVFWPVVIAQVWNMAQESK